MTGILILGGLKAALLADFLLLQKLELGGSGDFGPWEKLGI